MYKTDIFPIIKSACNKLCDFVAPTYGPSNNKIMVHGRVLDDGFAIAESFELDDSFENEIVKKVKEVASKTNSRVGDGTTGSLLVAQAIINGLPDDFEQYKITKELEKALESAKCQLKDNSHKIETQEELEQVSFNSFNNLEISKLIAEAIFKVGLDGVITIEDSNTLKTSLEIIGGMQLDQGFVSPYMITNQQRNESVFENAPILLYDGKLNNIKDIIPLLEEIIKLGSKELVIFANDFTDDVLGTIVLNKIQGNFNALLIRTPSFGDRKRDILEDIAALTGGTVINREKGLEINVEILGSAKKIISTKDKTLIVDGKGKKELIDVRVLQLKSEIETTSQDFDKRILRERIAKLSDGIAVIKVGATTESESLQLKFKVEDAVNSSKSAFRSGVVKGAGLALYEIQTESELFNKALKYPHEQLLKNTGLKVEDIGEEVQDSLEVITAALESAVSIVNLLISTKGIITNEKINQRQ